MAVGQSDVATFLEALASRIFGDTSAAQQVAEDDTERASGAAGPT